MALLNSIPFMMLILRLKPYNIIKGDAVNDDEYNFAVGVGLVYVSHRALD